MNLGPLLVHADRPQVARGDLHVQIEFPLMPHIDNPAPRPIPARLLFGRFFLRQFVLRQFLRCQFLACRLLLGPCLPKRSAQRSSRWSVDGPAQRFVAGLFELLVFEFFLQLFPVVIASGVPLGRNELPSVAARQASRRGVAGQWRRGDCSESRATG